METARRLRDKRAAARGGFRNSWISWHKIQELSRANQVLPD
jgi:hypothetical protein